MYIDLDNNEQYWGTHTADKPGLSRKYHILKYSVATDWGLMLMRIRVAMVTFLIAMWHFRIIYDMNTIQAD